MPRCKAGGPRGRPIGSTRRAGAGDRRRTTGAATGLSFRFGDHGIRCVLEPEPPPGYVCPICLRLFDETALETGDLTDEQVPPKSVGGERARTHLPRLQRVRRGPMTAMTATLVLAG